MGLVSLYSAERFTFTIRLAFWVLVFHSAGRSSFGVVINDAFCKSLGFKIKFLRLGVHKRLP